MTHVGARAQGLRPDFSRTVLAAASHHHTSGSMGWKLGAKPIHRQPLGQHHSRGTILPFTIEKFPLR